MLEQRAPLPRVILHRLGGPWAAGGSRDLQSCPLNTMVIYGRDGARSLNTSRCAWTSGIVRRYALMAHHRAATGALPSAVATVTGQATHPNGTRAAAGSPATASAPNGSLVAEERLATWLLEHTRGLLDRLPRTNVSAEAAEAAAVMSTHLCPWRLGEPRSHLQFGGDGALHRQTPDLSLLATLTEAGAASAVTSEETLKLNFTRDDPADGLVACIEARRCVGDNATLRRSSMSRAGLSALLQQLWQLRSWEAAKGLR